MIRYSTDNGSISKGTSSLAIWDGDVGLVRIPALVCGLPGWLLRDQFADPMAA